MPAICEFCGADRYAKGIRFGDRILWPPFGAEPCTCPEAVKAHERKLVEERAAEERSKQDKADKKLRDRVAKVIGDSGMGARFLKRTFETFEITEKNAKAAKTAKRFADAFDSLLPSKSNPEPGRNGLFIAGPMGTGKTHLAAAIANQIMQQGRAVICMTMIDLLERIKRTYAKGDVDEGSVLRIYKTVPLLIIDDMGKETPTEWAVSTIYNIINGRYEAYLPTIITTNYDADALIARMTPSQTRDKTTAEATIDRLLEMCRGITLDGQSWRTR